MFNWTEQPSDKGRLASLLIEFESSGNMPEQPEEPINGDVNYQLGHLNGSDFTIVKNCTLHFGQAGVISIVEAIQDTETPAEAKAAVEALLVDALEGASAE